MAVAVIVPVFLVILLGFALRRLGLFAEAFWEAAERLTYFMLLPALLVSVFSRGGIDLASHLGMVWVIAAAVGVVSLITLAARPLLGVDGPGITSVLQGALRQNSYAGLAIAAGLYGVDALAAAGIAVLTLVLATNLISVAALLLLGNGAGGRRAKPGARALAAQFVANPLILACLLGLALGLSGVSLPGILADLLALLGRAALPIGLLAVGAGLGSEAAGNAVLFTALPTASSSYILARRLGGDAALMAAIITLQTILALITLPLALTLLV
jgi:malonate transporter